MLRNQVVSLGVLAALALAGSQAHAEPLARQAVQSDAQSHALVQSFVEWTPEELATLNKAKRQLERAVPVSDTPLPYHAHNGTLDSIPDARVIHKGDCKTYSVAFRNILVEQYGFSRDSMLLALAYDEMDEPHMVLLIKVTDKGRERLVTYDARFGQIMKLEDLTNLGYRFWAREKAPDDIVIKWDGQPFV
jgi:predicted transglutaminase-like cysteine proteinase